MGMQILQLEEDEVFDLVYEKAPEDALDVDMELPSEFTEQADLETLAQGADALEAIHCSIKVTGIDKATAKNISGIVLAMRSPGEGIESLSFFERTGGHRVYQDSPGIEGLHFALETIAETVKKAYSAVVARIKSIVKTFIDWIRSFFKARSQSGQKTTVSEASREFAKSPNLKAITELLDSLSDDPEAAASEIARMAGGDTTVFATALKPKLIALSERLNKFFEGVSSNRAYARLVSGDVSVKDLMQEEADKGISEALANASKSADALLTAKNAVEYSRAVEDAQEALQALQALSTNSFDSTKDFEGTDSGVKLVQIIANVQKAVADLESADIDSIYKKTESELVALLKVVEVMDGDDAADYVPEGVTEDDKQKGVVLVTKLYAGIGAAVKQFSTLWSMRVKTLKGVEVVLSEVSDATASLTKDLSRLARELTDEQKSALQKTLATKGIELDFGTQEEQA